MDPTANLKEQLELAEKLVECDGTNDDIFEDAARLAELVLALNEWITKGGFPPKPWGKTR